MGETEGACGGGIAPIRLGVIGAGTIANAAYAVELKHPSVRRWMRPIAVCDHSRDRAERFAGSFTLAPRVFASASELLACEEVDAVSILVPTNAMPEIVRASLEAGKHVFSEKPIAPCSRQAQDMLRAWNSARAVWMVAENWRYEVSFQAAAAMIARGTIGRPVLADYCMFTPLDISDPYYKTPWRRVPELNPGGFILDCAVHQIAALRLLLGEVVDTVSVGRQNRLDLPPRDTFVSILRFESGAISTYSRTFACATNWTSGINVAGSDGHLRVDRGVIELTVKSHATEYVATARGNSGIRQLVDFAKAIQTGAPHFNSPHEALADLRVAEMIVKAASE